VVDGHHAALARGNSQMLSDLKLKVSGEETIEVAVRTYPYGQALGKKV
jgi:hypothetical protein